MSTTDASKYLPKLSFFCITFYADRTIYADNFGDKITSSTDYYLGSLNYPVLSRHHMNGIRAKNAAGFNLNASTSVKSVEMLFTPLTLAANTLFYASNPSATRLAWNGSGVVSKANIAKIYVATRKETTIRIDAMTVDLLDPDVPTATMLDFDYFQPLKITNVQPDGSTIVKTLQAQGFSWNITPNAMSVTVTTLEPIVEGFIIGSDVSGIIGTSIMAY